MKTKHFLLWALLPLMLAGCKGNDPYEDYEEGWKTGAEGYADAGVPSNHGGQGEDLSGQVTAGEWRDLDHWSFWGNLLGNQDYYSYTDNWSFYTNHRVAVRVSHAGQPVCAARVQLLSGGSAVWSAVTDNQGECNLWYSLYQNASETPDLAVSIDGQLQNGVPQVTAWNSTEVLWNEYEAETNSRSGVDIAFIVDATGSMTDEIDFLKADMLNIVGGIEQQAGVRTAALFYRDEGDEYVTKVNNFTTSPAVTAAFIKQQEASGGGDWPEAVHTAFEKSLQNLSWNESARVKIAFWLLDAPPHHEDQFMASIQQSLKTYAAKGIRIIPVAASGIDKETEILLRNYAIVTNGTYVFITNDSNVGGEHIEATVGDFEVELLRDLLIRLINEYTR